MWYSRSSILRCTNLIIKAVETVTSKPIMQPMNTDTNLSTGAIKLSSGRSIKTMMIATMALRDTFSRLNSLQISAAAVIPIRILKYSSIGSENTIIPDNAPIKLAFTRSMDNLFESFPSGEITSRIESKAQKRSNPGKVFSKKYPIENPMIHRMI